MTESEFEQIDDFLAGKLTTTEQQRMENAMAQDDQLRLAVEQHRTVREGLQVIAAKKRFEAMHRQLEQMGLLTDSEDDEREEPDVILVEDTTPDLEVIRSEAQEPAIHRDVPIIPIQRNYFWRYAAASILVGGLLGTLFLVQYRNNESNKSDVTFRQYYQPESSDKTPQLPPEERENQQELAKAIDDYRHNRLTLSEEKLRTLETTDKGTIRYYRDYYIGLIALENNQPFKAIDHLERARQAPLTDLQHRSEWYLGLAYLKAHRSAEAQQLFTQIANTPSHPFQQQASNLLRQHY